MARGGVEPPTFRFSGVGRRSGLFRAAGLAAPTGLLNAARAGSVGSRCYHGCYQSGPRPQLPRRPDSGQHQDPGQRVKGRACSIAQRRSAPLTCCPGSGRSGCMASGPSGLGVLCLGRARTARQRRPQPALRRRSRRLDGEWIFLTSQVLPVFRLSSSGSILGRVPTLLLLSSVFFLTTREAPSGGSQAVGDGGPPIKSDLHTGRTWVAFSSPVATAMRQPCSKAGFRLPAGFGS